MDAGAGRRRDVASPQAGRRRGRLIAAGLALALGAGACATSRPALDDGAYPGTVSLLVRNNHFNDVTVHAVVDGHRMRLGSVTGKTDQDFEIDWAMSRRLSLELRYLAAGSCITPPLDVDPGDILELEIQAVGPNPTLCRPLGRR